MALIDREWIYEQLTMKEIMDFYRGLPDAIRYERRKHTKMWSKISLLCGRTGLRPNQLIDALVDRAFEVAYGGQEDGGTGTDSSNDQVEG